MNLSDILAKVRTEIEADDRIRETVLPLSREAVRMCSLSIKESHRGNYDEASRLVRDAGKIIREATNHVSRSDFISKARMLDTPYQELAEASNVVSLLKDGEFTQPDDYGIPARPYLAGLADAVGELRRAVLDSLRNDSITRGERLLSKMEEILDELNTIDFPNALIPDLRRKCDVARGLIERTRGDVTASVQQEKLIRELKCFENGLKR
jgi:translin